MKKILLLSLATGFAVSSIAQTLKMNPPPSSIINKSIVKPGSKTISDNTESGIPYADKTIVSENEAPPKYPKMNRAGETKIGTTTFDIITSGQRLAPGPNGTLSAVWTGSSMIGDLTDTSFRFTDRGTYYNYFNGSNWEPLPTSRVESVYSGYPANVFTGHGGEWLTSNTSEKSLLGISKRPTAGTGSWSHVDSTDLHVLWPRAVAWNDYIHVIGAKTRDTGLRYIYYSRSSDGGATFDKVMNILPGIDTACVKFMWNDAYAIDARGSTVAIVGGGVTNSVFLWKSTDNGNTWDTTRIWDFGVCGFDGKTMTDNDGDLEADTITNSDGNYAILIDNDNIVHVWMGYTRITDDADTVSSFTYFYGPGTSGVLHWYETVPEGTLYVVGELLDVDDDEFLAIGRDWPIYGWGSQCSMPSVAIDTADNTIYLVFSMAVENTDVIGDPNDQNAQSFRDLYGTFSTDGGQTWSPQQNLTNSAVLNLENVYPCVSKYVRDGRIDVMWMQDGEPGIASDNTQQAPDLVHENDIMFKSFYKYDFTGIKNPSQLPAENLTVYPNPSNGIISMELNGFHAVKGKIQVVNMLGQRVKSFSNITLRSHLQLKADDLADGMYFITVETPGKTVTGKVTIAH